jgi:predicted glycosyltransferase
MRLMVYSHDTFGLGNIRRMLAICKYVHASIRDLSILIVSGSPMLQSFRVEPGIDYIKLPCLKRTELGELGVRFLDLDLTEIVRLRRELILSTVVSYRPDVVFVDKKPDGLAGELEPSLRHIKCSLSNTRIYLLLRDILDSAGVTIDDWTRHEYYNILQWYYDGVLVLGSQNIFDVCEEYQFPRSLREKVHHCGYVKRQLPSRSRSDVRKELGVEKKDSLVLVTAGGGQDGYQLFSAVVAATSSLAKRLPVKTLLVTGPELGTEQRRALARAAQSRNGMHVIEFTDDLMNYINAADVVISMAGYNTICELLTLGKRSIVVPRVRPVEEQKIRAERLADLRAFRIILPDELTPQALEATIEEEVRLTQRDVPVSTRIDLGALPRITAILQKEASITASDYGAAAVSEMLAPMGSEW